PVHELDPWRRRGVGGRPEEEQPRGQEAPDDAPHASDATTSRPSPQGSARVLEESPAGARSGSPGAEGVLEEPVPEPALLAGAQWTLRETAWAWSNAPDTALWT